MERQKGVSTIDFPDFPELLMEDEVSYRAACKEVAHFFADHSYELASVCALGRRIGRSYTLLEPYFQRFTESLCHVCATPCCVNRHGFPDFEDLILFLSMGVTIPHYSFDVIDTDVCQFLGEDGCRLPRQSRSYRCTWYFCDYVLDEFELMDRGMYGRFDAELGRLGHNRSLLLSQFRKIWFAYVS